MQHSGSLQFGSRCITPIFLDFIIQSWSTMTSSQQSYISILYEGKAMLPIAKGTTHLSQKQNNWICLLVPWTTAQHYPMCISSSNLPTKVCILFHFCSYFPKDEVFHAIINTTQPYYLLIVVWDITRLGKEPFHLYRIHIILNSLSHGEAYCSPGEQIAA